MFKFSILAHATSCSHSTHGRCSFPGGSQPQTKALGWAAPTKKKTKPLAKPQNQVHYQVCNLQSSNICYKYTFTQSWLDPYRTGIVSFKHFALKFLCWGQDKAAELLIHPPQFSSLCLWLGGTGGVPFTSPHFGAGCISPSGGACWAAQTSLKEPQAGHCHQCHHRAQHSPGIPIFLLPPFCSWWPFLLQKARKARGMLLLLFIWEPSSKAAQEQPELYCKLMIRQ